MVDYYSQSVFQPSIPKHLITEDDLEFLAAFNIDTKPYGDDKLCLFAEDWCSNAVMEYEDGTEQKLEEDHLFARFQEIIRRSNGELNWISKETSYTCSEMQPDGFGGSALFISADYVHCCSTSSWLEERIIEAETGDFEPHTEEAPVAPATSTELLQHLIGSFPQADPSSELYNEPIDGSEAVDFLSEFIPKVRDVIDSDPPAVAVVVEGA